MNPISLSECRHGHVYRIHSRNLVLGVFNQNTKGFIGIRTKFGNRYLFTEFHYETGAPFGTVRPLQGYGPLPEGIEVREYYNLEKDGIEYFATYSPLFKWLDWKQKELGIGEE